MTQLKTPTGNYYEDFSLGQIFNHGVPRTITEADASLYLALTGSRFSLHCAKTVAQQCGFQSIPIDNLLLFHVAFGKTVNDISLNAVANLGYAEVKFHQPCFAGDTISVTSEVIGLKENSNGKNGVVYVRSTAVNHKQQTVLSWIRWVMVKKSQFSSPESIPVIPEYCQSLQPSGLIIPEKISFAKWQPHFSDNQFLFEDFKVGDSIFHRDGITINDSDHSLATRLYQNNARVHFDQHMMSSTTNAKRLVYGGHIISLCRSLSYNGLGNSLWLCGINGGSHVNPSYAGDTIYCQSEIIQQQTFKERDDVGLVRIRTMGLKNSTPDDIPFLYQAEQKPQYHQQVVLDIDYWVLVLRKKH